MAAVGRDFGLVRTAILAKLAAIFLFGGRDTSTWEVGAFVGLGGLPFPISSMSFEVPLD